MTFSFESTIERMEDHMNYHAVPVPDPVSDQLRDSKVTRLLATVNGVTLRRAIQGPHDGGRFLIIGRPTLKELGLKYGDVVAMELEPDPDPDFIDIPMEFEIALEQDVDAKARWDTFTRGKQRSLVHFVSSAKRSDTRIKRSLELAEKIRTYTLYGDKKPE